MSFDAIEYERLSDKVEKKIIGMIASGSLRPGDKVPTESVFAKQIGVSRGILREALNILQMKGYVSRKPGNGTYIRELPEMGEQNYVEAVKKATYFEFIEARNFLEQEIVSLVIERASDEEIADLENYLDDTNIKSKNENFHIRLSELCKNSIFYNFMLLHHDLMKEMKKENVKNAERMETIIEEHTEIFKHIKNRDKLAAKQAISDHIKVIKKTMEE